MCVYVTLECSWLNCLIPDLVPLEVKQVTLTLKDLLLLLRITIADVREVLHHELCFVSCSYYTDTSAAIPPSPGGSDHPQLTRTLRYRML